MRMAYLRKPDDKKREEKCPDVVCPKSMKPSIPVAPLIPEGEDEASLQ